jgi:intergrase/recombinase
MERDPLRDAVEGWFLADQDIRGRFQIRHQGQRVEYVVTNDRDEAYERMSDLRWKAVQDAVAALPIAVERDEALAFARSEAKRNSDLQFAVTTLESRNKASYEALNRIRQTMKQHGFHGASYLGARDPETRETIGDDKRTPALVIMEQFINHLLKTRKRKMDALDG